MLISVRVIKWPHNSLFYATLYFQVSISCLPCFVHCERESRHATKETGSVAIGSEPERQSAKNIFKLRSVTAVLNRNYYWPTRVCVCHTGEWFGPLHVIRTECFISDLEKQINTRRKPGKTEYKWRERGFVVPPHRSTKHVLTCNTQS